jgi:hypothetical protein
MRYSLLAHGVPLGTVDLEAEDLTAGSLEPLPAYDAMRPLVQAASEALLAAGFFGVATSERLSWPERRALQEAAAMPLELRTPTGQEVATTFINLLHAPGESDPVVLVRFGHAAATIVATARLRLRNDGGENEPAA